VVPGAILYKSEPPVPFVPRSFLDITIFLYPSLEDAQARVRWGGSGFLLGVLSAANPSAVHLYAVTNQHVSCGAPVVRLTDKHGEVELHDGAASDWIDHPNGDDLAIRPLGTLAERRYAFLGLDSLLAPSDLTEYGVGPGDDCLMMGRYVNHQGAQFDRAAVRFGNISMLPEAIRQQERSFDQESFLVDMRSVSGFSGSPVFVYYEQTGPRAPIPKDVVDKFSAAVEQDWSGLLGKTWLLGVNWGNLPVWEDMKDEHGSSRGRVRINSSMACVVPAWKITDLLEVDEVVKPKNETEKKLAERGEGDAVLDASSDSEFDRFENLARKIIAVPKADIALALPGQFGIRETTAGCRANDGFESAVVVRLAHVEREDPLVEVAEQVERLDADVGAVAAALQQRPKVLDVVRMHLPVDVLGRVVNRAMVVVVSEVLVGTECIGIPRGSARPRRL
jgi:hypothetical protein